MKLGDFGLSKITSGYQTSTIINVGTLLYSAPELHDFEPHTKKTDIW